MNLKFLKYIFSFILLVLLQIVICNNINFSGYVNPFIYIAFILLLPITIKNWQILLVAFLLGAIIDIFCDSLGIHTFATVFIAFLRPAILRWVTPRGGYNTAHSLSIRNYGLSWFLLYASVTIFIHHFILFYLERFSFQYPFNTLLRVLVSFIFSLLCVLLFEIFRSQKRRE